MAQWPSPRPVTARTPLPKCRHMHTPTCSRTALRERVAVVFTMTVTVVTTFPDSSEAISFRMLLLIFLNLPNHPKLPSALLHRSTGRRQGQATGWGSQGSEW